MLNIKKKSKIIVHYNRWLTDNIQNYIKNLDNRIRFLFRPYEAFHKMDNLFGLRVGYITDKRGSRQAKRIIAKSILDNMRSNFQQKVQEWIKQYPELTELLLKAQSDTIYFIDYYENRFKPKPFPRYQMYEHHPNFNRKYFSEITTLEQAYWLGFLLADGWISLERKKSGDFYKMGFALKDKDKKAIVRFCKAVGLNPKYIEPYMVLCSFTNKKYSMNRIRWGDQDFAKDLIRLGMEYEYDDKKGKRVKIPTLPDLGSRELMLAFLLGFYDGDGSLGLTVIEEDKKYIRPLIASSNKEFLL